MKRPDKKPKPKPKTAKATADSPPKRRAKPAAPARGPRDERPAARTRAVARPEAPPVASVAGDPPESLSIELPPASVVTTPKTIPPEAPPPSALEGALGPTSVADVGAAIRELEAHLDTLMQSAQAQPSHDDPELARTVERSGADRSRTRPARPTGRRESSLGPTDDRGDDERLAEGPASAADPDDPAEAAGPRSRPPAPPESDATVFDSARELLSTEYYLRQWGRIGMRDRSEEVDDFGFDPVYAAKVRPLLDFLYTTYFRVRTVGVENVPAEGRCLLVANHSGTVPLDGVMIRTAIKREHPRARDVRWLSEDFVHHFPFVGSLGTRLGAVRACQENAERLLAHEELVCVFPEGIKGIGKLFRERYRLQRFGRGGFVKLCLRTQTPIVPVAVVGAEETAPLLFRHEYLARALGLPYVPITPTFPVLGPLGLLPAPTKWTITFGEPIVLDHGPEAADDEAVVARATERVRATIQSMLDREVGARRSVFFG